MVTIGKTDWSSKHQLCEGGSPSKQSRGCCHATSRKRPRRDSGFDGQLPALILNLVTLRDHFADADDLLFDIELKMVKRRRHNTMIAASRTDAKGAFYASIGRAVQPFGARGENLVPCFRDTDCMFKLRGE